MRLCVGESHAHTGPPRFVRRARYSFSAQAPSRCLVAVVVCFIAAVCLRQQTALGDGFGSLQTAGSSNESESPLAVPGVQILDEDQQTRAAAEARRTSPAALIARLTSEHAYEHLAAPAAQKLTAELLPRLIDEPAGGPPSLPVGQSAVAFPRDNLEVVALPSGGRRAAGNRALIETLGPIALATGSPRRYAPIDLHLRETGGAFRAVRPLVDVHVPKRLRDGIALSSSGVSLTPVDASGTPLSGAEGVADGLAIDYANSLADGDSLVKLTSSGFSAETVLRGADSPTRLYFRLGLPAGARVQSAGHGAGLRVVQSGTTIATMSEPAAQDAEGAPVPVSMGLSGDIATLTLAPFAGRYRLPIVVDPTIGDTEFGHNTGYQLYESAWYFQQNGSAFKAPAHPENERWEETIEGTRSQGQFGQLTYTTKGESQITYAAIEGNWNDSGASLQAKRNPKMPTSTTQRPAS